MKKTLLFIVTVFVISTLHVTAQNESGQLKVETIATIQATFENTPTNTALINAITHNDIKKLAETRSNEGVINHFFSNKVDVNGITNQNTGFPDTPYNYSGIFHEINNEEVRSCNIEITENIMTFSLQTEDCWNGCPNAKVWEATISEDCSEVTITLDVISNKVESFSISPNPTSNIITLAGIPSNIDNVTIYNIQGQIVKAVELENTAIDVSTLNSGMYFLMIRTSDGKKAIQKFIKS